MNFAKREDSVAGDWIKMEAATPDKSEVLAITAAMGWEDPDLTVGKLFRVWRWFDQQTVDGNARGVTSALLDRVAGVNGFAEAMRNVGWLTIKSDGIELPNFHKHNGKTAKARALTANRVRNFKAGNAEGNGEVTPPPLPREEKRRKEKEKKSMSGSDEPDIATGLAVAARFWNDVLAPAWGKPKVSLKTLRQLDAKYRSLEKKMQAEHSEWTLEESLRRAMSTLPRLSSASWFTFREGLFQHDYHAKNLKLWTGFYTSIYGAEKSATQSTGVPKFVPFGVP